MEVCTTEKVQAYQLEWSEACALNLLLFFFSRQICASSLRKVVTAASSYGALSNNVTNIGMG
jgi:hypothetical protein